MLNPLDQENGKSNFFHGKYIKECQMSYAHYYPKSMSVQSKAFISACLCRQETVVGRSLPESLEQHC
jgi:hypothetical protein